MILLFSKACYFLSETFAVCPEVMFDFDNFSFDYVSLYPGVMFNYVGDNFFIGAGPALNMYFESYEGESDNETQFKVKVNAGIRTGPVILTVFFIPKLKTESRHWLGATVGIEL